MDKRHIKGPKASLFLKLLLGPVLFAWMVYSGKLNLHQVVGGFSHWQVISAMIAGLASSQLLRLGAGTFC